MAIFIRTIYNTALKLSFSFLNTKEKLIFIHKFFLMIEKKSLDEDFLDCNSLRCLKPQKNNDRSERLNLQNWMKSWANEIQGKTIFRWKFFESFGNQKF